jgi:hypothetical protein
MRGIATHDDATSFADHADGFMADAYPLQRSSIGSATDARPVRSVAEDGKR